MFKAPILWTQFYKYYKETVKIKEKLTDYLKRFDKQLLKLYELRKITKAIIYKDNIDFKWIYISILYKTKRI